MLRDGAVAHLGALVLLLWGSGLVLWFGQRSSVVWPVAVTLATRLIWGFGSLWMVGLDASDASGFDARAWSLAQGGSFESSGLTAGKEGWPVLLSFLYRIFGHAPEVGLVVNSLLAALVPLVIATACRQLGWHRAAIPAAWIAALWPTSIVWGGLLVRESTVSLLLACMLLAAAQVRNKQYLRGISLLLAASLVMLYFRGGLAIIGIAVLPSVLLVDSLVQRRTNAGTRGITVAVLALAGLLLLPAFSVLAGRTGYLEAEQISTTSTKLDKGSTGVSAGGGGITGAVTPQRVAVNLPSSAFGPFPWNWRNMGLLIAGLDGILWLGVWVMVWIGIRRGPPDLTGKALCLIPTFGLLLYLGATLGNYGLLMRMRALEIPFLAPLAAVGLVTVWQSRKARRQRGRRSSVTADPRRGRHDARMSASAARERSLVGNRINSD